MNCVLVVGLFGLLGAVTAARADEPNEKRFVMQFRQEDGSVSGLEIIVAHREDESRSPGELLKRQVGLKWSDFLCGGTVYRLDANSKTWEPIMTRDMYSTETRIGKVSGLKISELRTGDILILYSCVAF